MCAGLLRYTFRYDSTGSTFVKVALTGHVETTEGKGMIPLVGRLSQSPTEITRAFL